MQVILQKTVTHLGMVGDVVDVKSGFFRNYLGPQGFALIADPKSIKQIEHQKKMIEFKKAKEKIDALKIKERLEAELLKITHAAGSMEKLFGSVTSQEVQNRLREAGFLVERRYILMDAPLRTVGKHIVQVKLHPEVIADVIIEIEGKLTQLKTPEASKHDDRPKKATRVKKGEVKADLGAKEAEVEDKTQGAASKVGEKKEVGKRGSGKKKEKTRQGKKT